MDKATLAIAAVLTLADEVRAHLEAGDLAGKTVVLPGHTEGFGAEATARIVLADVERCRRLTGAERRAEMSLWHALAEQLRAIERATLNGR